MENEFDNVQDDFADFIDVDWDGLLLENRSATDRQPAVTVRSPASPLPSTYSDELYDSATLAEIDELERRALTRPTESSPPHASSTCLYASF
ncbi:hypothetical protein AX17_000093 [Amanita inopinata Kibby_2008]|nr:hypothetical protein AX17_000093 [Amanita inopinata Kibby_2008]